MQGLLPSEKHQSLCSELNDADANNGNWDEGRENESGRRKKHVIVVVVG